MNMLIVFAAKYLFLVSIALLLWFFLTLSNPLRKRFVTFAFASFGLAFVFAKLLGALFYDPRPFVSDHITPLIAHAADNGFPSDHTLLTMTIAAVVFVYNKRLGVLLAIISFVIGYARVVAGIHHIIDIVGAIGIAIGTVSIMSVFGILIQKNKKLHRRNA